MNAKYEAMYTLIDSIWDFFVEILHLSADQHHTPNMDFFKWIDLQLARHTRAGNELTSLMYNPRWECNEIFLMRYQRWVKYIFANFLGLMGSSKRKYNPEGFDEYFRLLQQIHVAEC